MEQGIDCKGRHWVRKKIHPTGKDYTDQKFGLLTCLERLIMEDGLTYYRCKCNCGKEKIAYTSYLINGTVKSCGCLTSWKEKEIEEILTKLQIPFEQQYRIKECRDKLPLPFDFIIYNNNHYGLIEYQGKQHYIQSKQWDDIEDFQKRQKHDKIKYEYCLNNNIPLLILNHLSDLEKEIKDFYEKLGRQAVKI